MNILGIESTCDETGVAIVKDGVHVVKNFLASSADLQARFGGVIPEVAAREQVKVIVPLISKAVENDIDHIDAIAVSYGPGLIGSLLVGVESAKALAFAWNKKLIAVNHLVGHVYASWLDADIYPEFPLIGLVVSGGHTDLVLMKDHGDFELLGSTLDDAAGEAFDKVAKKLGLGYPGGPKIEQAAKKVVANNNFDFPKSLVRKQNFDFSFSGVKTSVANFVDNNLEVDRDKIAFEFQRAVVDVLVLKTIAAAKHYDARTIVAGGGVAANSVLKTMMEKDGLQINAKVFFPKKIFAVDNGAMIAAAAFFTKSYVGPLSLVADPGLHF